jgi:hypothetical protein
MTKKIPPVIELTALFSIAVSLLQAFSDLTGKRLSDQEATDIITKKLEEESADLLRQMESD